MDNLGLAAYFNHKTHCRQSLIGGNYGLVILFLPYFEVFLLNIFWCLFCQLNTTTYEPNPDFYRFPFLFIFPFLKGLKISSFPLGIFFSALFFKSIMGRKVLNVEVENEPNVRAYAHCLRRNRQKIPSKVVCFILIFCILP